MSSDGTLRPADTFLATGISRYKLAIGQLFTTDSDLAHSSNPSDSDCRESHQANMLNKVTAQILNVRRKTGLVTRIRANLRLTTSKSLYVLPKAATLQSRAL